MNEYVANIMLILFNIVGVSLYVVHHYVDLVGVSLPEYRGGEQGQGEVLEARPVRGATMEQQCCPLPLLHLLPGLRNSFSARKENMMLYYHLLCDQLKRY